MVRYVISDIDGTLIYKGAHLNTARFPVMLKKLKQQNIPFAVATGRHYSELKKLFGEYVKDIICICCDGAYTVHNVKTLTACAISPKLFDNFTCNNASENAVVFHSINCNYFYGNSAMLFNKERTRLGNIEKIDSVAEITNDIFKISVYGVKNNFQVPLDMRLCYSSHGIKEYVSAKASKLYAVKTLCEPIGIPLSDILFFGDGVNDKDLILSCGISYTTYCADRSVFSLTNNHTRDVIGTTIRLADTWQKFNNKEATT